MKKILVPVKRVPDYAVKVKIAANGKEIESAGIKWIVNPFDEIAVEEALRIKERGGEEVEVVVVSIGPAECAEQIRTALAMGADRGILVESSQIIDSHIAAQALRGIFLREQPSVVIMGKQAIDSDASQTGQLLAQSLQIPQATFASKVELDWQTATVTREVDGGLETVRVSLPAVITTDLRLNEPRYPSLPGIVKAKKKPLDTVPLAELGVEGTPKVSVVKLEIPPARKAGGKVASVVELLEKLQSEAKVF